MIQIDFDFADDIALVSDSVEKVQALLFSVEGECQKMGLELNAKKTEVMTFNINEKAKITTKNGTMLAVKESWILHQLDRKGHPDTEGSCMENTPRPQEYLALCYAW